MGRDDWEEGCNLVDVYLKRRGGLRSADRSLYEASEVVLKRGLMACPCEG